MENVYVLYFIQIFVVIPIMLTCVVSRYLRIPINDYSMEQLILFGYFIILYCSARHSQSPQYGIYYIL